MKITTIGLDLAKSVFQVHAVDAGGRVVLRKQVKRAQMKAFFAKLPPCLVGMEACGGAHYWGRELQALGHVVKLMPPQYVKPFVKRNKNDAADAEAICEAVQRPNMHFVPIKTVEQQAILAVHRVRQGLVKARTAQANQIRGLLAEFGLAIPKGIAQIEPRVLALLEDGNNGLPDSFRRLLEQLRQRLGALGRQQAELEVQIKDWHTQHEDSRRLATIPGVGPLSASALVASVGPARTYKNGRQLSACLGMVPRQASSGGKTTLLGITAGFVTPSAGAVRVAGSDPAGRRASRRRRGSSGRGLAYTRAIEGDWGNKEVLDILGAADQLTRSGIVDPENMGIGGWSYGGILTNYTIASDTRFKAACSGAGSALQLSLVGVDQYITQFENEIGLPWKDKNLDKYLKLSYPYLKADRIKTPTLFLTGEKDFNVPAIGSEQMYQALKILGVPTELIVYPGQFHGLTNPAFVRDRLERYAAWFGRYLKKKSF